MAGITPRKRAITPEEFIDGGEPGLSEATPRRSKSKSVAWPDDLAKTLLIRHTDPAVPAMLIELAEREERSQNQIARMALARGLRDMIAESSPES